MIFLTTGEKIRSLRKKFGMRQQELEDKNITRAFISMIETGKRGLSRENAKVIAEKFNNKAASLGLKANIEEDYLLRTPEEDAEIYCFEKLNNNPTNDEIEVIIEIARKYNLTKVEAKSYKILGDYDYQNERYSEAFINYMFSLDLYKNTDGNTTLAYLYNRMGMCKSSQLEYAEALSFFNRANHYSVLSKDLKIQKYSLYNIAKNYKMLEKYDEALAYIDKYLALCDKENEFTHYVYINILKANCYSRKGNKEKAVLIHKELVNEFEDKNDMLLWDVYSNLGTIYRDENSLDESLEYYTKAEKIAEGKDGKSLAATLIQKSGVYIVKGLYDEALKLVNKGLKIAWELNDIATLVKGYYKLIDIYTALNDFVSLKNTYIKLLDTIKNKKYYKDDTVKIYNKLALLYLEQNDIEMCKKYLSIVT